MIQAAKKKAVEVIDQDKKVLLCSNYIDQITSDKNVSSASSSSAAYKAPSKPQEEYYEYDEEYDEEFE